MITYRLASLSLALTTAFGALLTGSAAAALPHTIDPFAELTGVGARADGLAADSEGNLYVLDKKRNEVVKFDAEGRLTETFSLGTGAKPYDIAVDGLGIVYISDEATGAVARIVPGNAIDLSWKAVPHGHARELNVVRDGVVNVVGETTTGESREVYQIEPAGAVVLLFTSPTTITGLGSDGNGSVYVSTRDGRVVKYGWDTKLSTTYIDGGPSLADIEVRRDGTWMVLNSTTNRIVEHTASNDLNTTALGYTIADLTMDAAGTAYFIKGDGAVMSLDHGGATPTEVARFTSASGASNVKISPRQYLFADRGYDPTVSAVPLLPGIEPLGGATGTVGASFSTTIAASEGIGEMSYSATGMPSWLTLDARTGTLAGVPTEPGDVTVEITATNHVGPSEPQKLTISVAPAPVVTTPPAPNGGAGSTAAGGTAGGSGTAGSGSAGAGRATLASTGSEAGVLALAAVGLLAIGGTGALFRRRRHRV